MHTLPGMATWVKRWRYEMEAKSTRPGIWKLKGGGYLIRARLTDPRTGKEYQRTTVLRGERLSIRDAVRVQDQLRSDTREQIEAPRSMPLWSAYAASLF